MKKAIKDGFLLKISIFITLSIFSIKKVLGADDFGGVGDTLTSMLNTLANFLTKTITIQGQEIQAGTIISIYILVFVIVKGFAKRWIILKEHDTLQNWFAIAIATMVTVGGQFSYFKTFQSNSGLAFGSLGGLLMVALLIWMFNKIGWGNRSFDPNGASWKDPFKTAWGWMSSYRRKKQDEARRDEAQVIQQTQEKQREDVQIDKEEIQVNNLENVERTQDSILYNNLLGSFNAIKTEMTRLNQFNQDMTLIKSGQPPQHQMTMSMEQLQQSYNETNARVINSLKGNKTLIETEKKEIKSIIKQLDDQFKTYGKKLKNTKRQIGINNKEIKDITESLGAAKTPEEQTKIAEEQRLNQEVLKDNQLEIAETKKQIFDVQTRISDQNLEYSFMQKINKKIDNTLEDLNKRAPSQALKDLGEALRILSEKAKVEQKEGAEKANQEAIQKGVEQVEAKEIVEEKREEALETEEVNKK